MSTKNVIQLEKCEDCQRLVNRYFNYRLCKNCLQQQIKKAAPVAYYLLIEEELKRRLLG